jgi:hypothetical protein
MRVLIRRLAGWRRAPTLGTMPVHDPDDSVPSNDFGHRADLATRRANSRGTSRAADGDGDCHAGTKDDGGEPGEASTQSSTNAKEADDKEDDNADEEEDFDDEEEEEEEEEVHGIVDYIMGKRGSVTKGTRQ